MDVSPATLPAPGDVLGPAGERVPFSVRGRDVTCTEALQSLALRGAWREVVDEVGRGEGALTAADDVVRADIEARLPTMEMALRRRLGLTTADDYLAWLDSHGLSVPDCREHLRRRLAAEAWADDPDRPRTVSVAAVRAHVVLDGVLDSAVRRLAEDAALADVEATDASWLAAVVDAAAAERAREPDPDDVAALIARYAVDWTRVEASLAVVPDDDVARELILCVRERHAPLATVAAEVGVPVEHVSTTLDSVEPWIEHVLVGAEPGQLHGPLAYKSARVVVELEARVHPTVDDDASRGRAEELLLQRRTAVAMASTVRWSADG